MASSAMMDTPPDSHDDRRQRVHRASRGGYHSRTNSTSAGAGQGGLRPPSPPLEKHQLTDEPYISPESDTDDDTAPPVRAPQPPAVPDSPSRRSPGKSRPPVVNNPGSRDSWGPQARPLSMGPPDDGRRNSGSHNANGGAARYRRHEQMNGRPHSGQLSSGPKPNRSDVPPGRRGPPPDGRRPQTTNVDARHQVASPTEPSPTKSLHIDRIESPGIMQSVLQPLKQKLNEYERLMSQSQAEMTQLDEELRALQERRRQAEDRFLDAKDKHDEYERQHEDVERALRGQVQHQHQPQSAHAPLYAPHMMGAGGPVQRPATMESYDGGGGAGMGERRPTSNPVSNRSSRTRHLGTMDKLRLRFLGS